MHEQSAGGDGFGGCSTRVSNGTFDKEGNHMRDQKALSVRTVVAIGIGTAILFILKLSLIHI